MNEINDKCDDCVFAMYSAAGHVWCDRNDLEDSDDYCIGNKYFIHWDVDECMHLNEGAE